VVGLDQIVIRLHVWKCSNAIIMEHALDLTNVAVMMDGKIPIAFKHLAITSTIVMEMVFASNQMFAPAFR
jgi:hypothetical protein